jgi:ketosteroid isomerase-like protein
MVYTYLRLALLTATICVAIAQPSRADDTPILAVGTENLTGGEVRPSAALVRIVMRALDRGDVAGFDECLAEHELKRADYGALLLAVKIDAGAGRNLWFVRRTLQPFCSAVLYGAHSFTYFLVEERPPGARERYRLVFQHTGDQFAIYPQQNHGLNDIEATGCIAVECRSVRMSFDGEKYKTARCAITTFENGREEKKERQCGSDDGRDDQSSGLVLPPKN